MHRQRGHLANIDPAMANRVLNEIVNKCVHAVLRAPLIQTESSRR